MRYLIYAMILAVFLGEYLSKAFHLPKFLGYAPEAVSFIAALVVMIRLPKNHFRDVDSRYLLIFGLLLVHVAVGVLANHLPPGVVVAGIRFYLKSLPFFFLPFLMDISERDLKRYLWLIAALTLIQLPIAWEQRMATGARLGTTGDNTVGTLLNSSVLSVYISCTTAVALGMFLRERLKLPVLVMFLALTVPATMINETKGSLVMLPLAFVIPAMFAGSTARTGAFKRGVLTVMLTTAFLAAFIPVYDYFVKPRWGYGIIEFIQMHGRVENYLMKDSELGSTKVGKLDSLLLPFRASQHDATQVAIGLGIGNVSESGLGKGFTGENYERYGKLVGPSASLLLWEIGWIGLALIGLMLWMIFRDALIARREPTLMGALGVGWVGVLGMIGIGLFYSGPVGSAVVSYLFFFFSGIVAATSLRVRREAAEAAIAERYSPPRLRPLRPSHPAIGERMRERRA